MVRGASPRTIRQERSARCRNHSWPVQLGCSGRRQGRRYRALGLTLRVMDDQQSLFKNHFNSVLFQNISLNLKNLLKTYLRLHYYTLKNRKSWKTYII